MKRPREDVASGPQVKRTHGPVPEKPYEAPAPGAKLTTDDALAYLKAVKDKFRDDKVKYDEFLEVMKDFKATRIDTAGVIVRVKELFKGHRNLILGFNTFLPKGFEITLPEVEEEEDPVSKKPVEFDQAINYVNKIKTRFSNNDAVYKTFLEILNMYRKGNKLITEVYKEVSTLFADHKDLLDEFTYFLPDTSSPWVMTQPLYPKAPLLAAKTAPPKDVSAPSQRVPPLVKRQGLSEPSKVKEERREKDLKPPVDVRAPREAVRKGEKMPGLKRGDDGSEVKEMTAEERRAHKNANLQKELVFFEKVKARLRNKDTYQDFLKCLNLFSQEIIGRTELHSLVSDILGKFPDLMEGFNDFLARCESLEEAVKPRLEKPAAAPMRDIQVARPALPAKKDYHSRPISELDLSACERCTPSYRLLPKNFPRANATYRTELCRKVLNDDWVSVTSGSEDYSFKHMRRNQYEEALFRCEDDRYELDMLLESTSFTARKVKELEERCAKEGERISIDELNPVNLRCVERIYGDHGLDILEMLRRNPTTALPVLYQRLCQKKEEWVRCREDMNKVWRDVYAKNYHKSLDHRSFYFKQLDKRSLSTKGLLLEIKEVNEQKRREDDNILALASGSRRPLISDYIFELPEPSVHNDLYNIIKFAADETLSEEQSAKVMAFWTSFIEPFFGVDPRVLEDSLEVAGKGKGSTPAIEAKATAEGKTVTAKHGEKGEKGAADAEKKSSAPNAKPAVPSSEGKEQQEPTLDGLAAGATHALAANADAAAASTVGEAENQGPVHTVGAGSTIPLEAAPPATGPQDGAKPKVDAVEEDENVKGGVSIEKGTPGHEEAERVRAVEKAAALVGGPSAQGNGVVAEGGRKEELEATPSGEEERADEAGAAGPSKALANGDRKHPEGDDMEVDGDNEADADDEGEDGHGSPEESGDDSDGPEEGHFSDAEEDEQDDDDEDGDDGEGGADAEDDETSPSGPERAFSQCKPLAARQITGFESAPDRHIYYGNDMYYVLFRLHQILYERVSAAKHAAREAEEKWRQSKDTPPPDLYAKFMQILYSLLDGQIDNSRFEDECRAMLGTSSYVLFTLDKLVFKFVKQIQSAAVDDVSNKMLALYSYEKSKATNGVIDLIYHANSTLLLQDEASYRFEYNKANGTFSIQMMDPAAEKLEMTAGAIEPMFNDYLTEFLQSIPDPKASRVFLTRNARQYLSLPEEVAFVRATANTRIYNGLECKITCQNSKVSYVLDTEDLFHRKRDSRAGADRAVGKGKARVEKFQKWVESRTEVTPAAPQPEPQPELD